jgi:hypothetical protein
MRFADDPVMEPNLGLPEPPDPTVVDLARVLVLLQGAFAVLSTVELGVWAIFGGIGTLAPSFALTAAAAVATLSLAAGLGRRARRSRRLVLWVEGAVLFAAAADLVLALLLAHRPLELVPMLTRVALPIAVIVLMRRPVAKAMASSAHVPSPPEGALA